MKDIRPIMYQQINKMDADIRVMTTIRTRKVVGRMVVGGVIDKIEVGFREHIESQMTENETIT